MGAHQKVSRLCSSLCWAREPGHWGNTRATMQLWQPHYWNYASGVIYATALWVWIDGAVLSKHREGTVTIVTNATTSPVTYGERSVHDSDAIHNAGFYLPWMLSTLAML